MAIWKFAGIGKANEEISNLETKVAELASQNTALTANALEVETGFAAVRAELTEAHAKLAQSTADLATAQASIASLSKEKESAVAALATHQANPSAEVRQLASAQAAQIVASVGVPPMVSSHTDGSKEMSRSEFSAKSPREQSDFFKAGGRIV